LRASKAIVVISHIDHLVLTVDSLDATCAFYQRVLGFERVDAPGKPTGLHFGNCKINVHPADRTFEPKAAVPTRGAGDFCLITEGALADVERRLIAEGVTIEVGPVARNGARGAMTSVYFRDPDGNLVEVSRYDA
jgi:catechol 2,3-dioxygenase-like lactoylglutathione lyase family enzyme